jgi:hypothetical protein
MTADKKGNPARHIIAEEICVSVFSDLISHTCMVEDNLLVFLQREQWNMHSVT